MAMGLWKNIKHGMIFYVDYCLLILQNLLVSFFVNAWHLGYMYFVFLVKIYGHLPILPEHGVHVERDAPDSKPFEYKEKVQVGKDQKKAQSEKKRFPLQKPRWGKKLN